MLKAFEAMGAYQTNVAVWTLRKLSRAAAAITLLSLGATKFELEKRFWIICAIYFVGFC